MLGIQRANMVGLIARIEARGWLLRERVDGRSQALSLSSAGNGVLERAWVIVLAFETSLVERVPAELRHHVVPILRHLWSESQTAGGQLPV